MFRVGTRNYELYMIIFDFVVFRFMNACYLQIQSKQYCKGRSAKLFVSAMLCMSSHEISTVPISSK